MANTTSPLDYSSHYETALVMQDISTVSNDAISATEIQSRGFVVLRISADTEGAQAALAKLDIELPSTLGMTGSFDDKLVKWISPDEYLITLALSEKDQFIQDAKAALEGIFSAVVDNSGGYSLLRITGSERYEVLSKLCVYDVRNNLPVGKVVSTLWAKAPAIFYRLDDDSIMVMVRFSFADYAWLAFESASREYLTEPT